MKCVECDGKDSGISVATNTWIADSGASCHMTNSDEDLTDVKLIDEFVKIGNGKEMRATKIGHVNGKTTRWYLEESNSGGEVCSRPLDKPF